MEVAVFSVVGIAIGAVLQYVFTRFLEERRHKRELRSRAYADYIQCVSEMKHQFIQSQARHERELLARFTNAKVRVGLYGTPAVVRTLAEFERQGSRLGSRKQEEAFVALLRAMRGHSDVTGEELGLIVMGSIEN